MQVVYNEQPLLTLVADFLVDFRFIDPASNRACEEGAIVNTAHVVTCSSEGERDPEN